MAFRRPLARLAAVIFFIWIAAPLFHGGMSRAAAETAAQRLDDESIDIVVRRQSLHSVLRILFSANSINYSSGDIKDQVVQNIRLAGSPRDSLERLALDLGLSFFWEADVLHVSWTAENEAIVIDRPGVTPELLRNSLTDLQVYDPRFTIKASPQTGLILVSGPPRYVELVRAIAEALGPTPTSAPVSADSPTPISPTPRHSSRRGVTVFRGLR